MKLSEHKTVQHRILAYAQEVGWSFVERPSIHYLFIIPPM